MQTFVSVLTDDENLERFVYLPSNLFVLLRPALRQKTAVTECNLSAMSMCLSFLVYVITATVKHFIS